MVLSTYVSPQIDEKRFLHTHSKIELIEDEEDFIKQWIDDKNPRNPVSYQCLDASDQETGFIEKYWNIIVPDDAATIQQAIDQSSSGYRIFVRAGTYQETLTIEKPIILKGENSDTTTISGDNKHNTIMVKSGFTEISGFSITGGKHGINLNASGGNVIKDLHIIDNEQNGLFLFRSYGNTIQETTIKNNKGHGIFLSSSFGNLIYQNTIKDNDDSGILIDGASRNNVISVNTIQTCYYGIKINDESKENQIKYNHFINNEVNAYDSSTNIWDDTVRRGNYWSDYSGADTNGDGIGETAYDIPGGENQDRFPDMRLTVQQTITAGLFDYDYQKRPRHGPSIPITSSFSTIVVPDDYPTIQQAINNAKNGDTIEVKNGVYYENIIVNKSVSLKGEEKDSTIIDGNDEGHVINIAMDNVEISGFTLRDTELDSAGIFCESDGSIIVDTEIIECGIGIHLFDADFGTLTNNKLYGNNWGIYCEFSDDNTIDDNYISSNNDGMIMFSSYRNQFINNRVNNNNFQGICTFFCNHNSFDGNTIEENVEFGIQLFDSNTNNFINNRFDDNQKDAIAVRRSNENDFTLNTISEGPHGIALWYESNNNSIRTNEFLKNSINGVILMSSSDNIVENNKIEQSNNNAVYMCANSENNSIDSNEFRDCTNFGFFIDYANNAEIKNNHFYDCSLRILNTYGNNIHSNYVGNKPLIYLEDASHQTLEDVGQVILINCDNVTIKNSIISNIPIGIEIIDSKNCHIDYCTITDLENYGIYIHENSESITVENNQFSGNNYGIYLLDTLIHIKICYNVISQNSYGIYLEQSSNNQINNNTIRNNKEAGIKLFVNSRWNTISDNDFSNHPKETIEVSSSSSYNEIMTNTITNNMKGITIYSSSNTISGNNIKDNNGDGIIIYNNVNKINKNSISHNTNGIRIINGDDNIIEDNMISVHTNDGLYLQNSETCTLKNNEIESNKENGINLYDCEDCLIEFNKLRQNEESGVTEFFNQGYPISNKNRIINNCFFSNNKDGYFKISEFGILLGWYFFYGSIPDNWNKNYWENWNAEEEKIIKGDMSVYGGIFSIPVRIKDKTPLSTCPIPDPVEPGETKILKSVLTPRVSGYESYDRPTNRFIRGTEIYSYSKMINAEIGDTLRWDWYHGDELRHSSSDTATVEKTIGIWDSWVPDRTGWWEIKIYHNTIHLGTSPSFLIYEQDPVLIGSVLTDNVWNTGGEPLWEKPSTTFEFGKEIFTLSVMNNHSAGDVITWDWIHNDQVKYSKAEEIPSNEGAILYFWDPWAPDEKGWWQIRISINNKVIGYSPGFSVEDSYPRDRIGCGDAMICKWVNEDTTIGGPMEICAGVNETIWCFATFTAKKPYNWRGDEFQMKWIHNEEMIADFKETVDEDYEGYVRMWNFIENIPPGSGYVELYVNSVYIGKTNPYEVKKDYHDITPVVGLGEALVCEYAYGKNNHGPINLTFNQDEVVYFYASFETGAYNWLNDKFSYRWYHNQELMKTNESWCTSLYSGTISLHDSIDKLGPGKGFIELYWNGEYLGKTYDYNIN